MLIPRALLDDGYVDLAAVATRPVCGQTQAEGRAAQKSRLRDFVRFCPEARRWKGRHSMVQGCYRGPSGGALVGPGTPVQSGLESRPGSMNTRETRWYYVLYVL